jgi:hypothetical protein
LTQVYLHEGNEYEIIHQYGTIVVFTVAFRQMKYNHIEIIEVNNFLNLDKINTFTSILHKETILTLASRIPFLDEVELREQKEAFNHELLTTSSEEEIR